MLNPPSGDANDATDDADDDSELQEWVGKALLLKLMDFCALRSKSDMVKAVLCPAALDGAGKQVCINGECSVCGMAKLWSKGLRDHVVDAYGNVRASAPVEFQSQVTWNRIRSSNKTNPGEAKQPAYEHRTGTVVQFLDEFERDIMKKFPHHRFTITRTKATAAQFERNRGPGWVQVDVDFAMDGTIPPPHGRSIQSDHWSPMSFTLFMVVVSFLETAVWICRQSALAVGTAVTVEPADASVRDSILPAPGSFWAEVVELPRPCPASSVGEAAASDPERKLYGIRRHGAAQDQPLEYVERRFLRHRKLQTKCFAHVSDDKTHDSHAAQTFINKTIDYLEEHYVNTGKERFFAWHMHSDNAPSHFKSSKTMHYVTTLPARLKQWAAGMLHIDGTHMSFRFFWEFGAPGHGKGVWDGLGAWMKRTVRQDIIDHRTEMPTIQTAHGTILSPAEVAEHLKNKFQTAAYVQAHVSKTINEVIVEYTPTHEIVRPKPDHDFDRMPGMKKTFLFMPVSEGVTLQRKFACWCEPCMRASAPGEGSMDTVFRCTECSSDEQWIETSVQRTDKTGVGNEKVRVRNRARDLAQQLKGHFAKTTQPVWVAVQNRGEHDPDQYWIGRALSISKEHDLPGTVPGTGGRVRYDKGDMEIAVEWFDRDISGGDERCIFKRWSADDDGKGGPVEGETYTFNSTELRMINVEMQLVLPLGGVPLNVVQTTARPRREAADRGNEQRVQQQNYNPLRATNPRGIAAVVHKQHATPPEQLWEIPAGNERLILQNCC